MSEESDETRRVPPADDATLPGKQLDDTVAEDSDLAADGPLPSAGLPPAVDDATRVAPAVTPEDRSVWSGRAEVRSPRPAQSIYDTDWSDDGPMRTASDRRDRWWMPI